MMPPDFTEAIRQRVIPAATPAAGGEVAFLNNTGNVLRVQSVTFQLVTSAVAGNRSVSLAADDGTSTYWRSVASGVQAASLTQRYSAGIGAALGGSGTIVQMIELPQTGVLLYPGHVLRTLTGALDVGDQYGAITVQAEELPQGPFSAVYPSLPIYSEDW